MLVRSFTYNAVVLILNCEVIVVVLVPILGFQQFLIKHCFSRNLCESNKNVFLVNCGWALLNLWEDIGVCS